MRSKASKDGFMGAHDIRGQAGRGDKSGEMSTAKLIYSFNKIRIDHHHEAGAALGTGVPQ